MIRGHGRQKGHQELRNRALERRQGCRDLTIHGFKLDDSISLSQDVGLGKDYEASTIAHKLYSKNAVPDDVQILGDLEAVLSAYDRYVGERANQGNSTPWPPEAERASTLELSVIVTAFSDALRASYVDYGRDHLPLARSFITSLATKPLLIITGLSGSGKTQIGIRFGEWIGMDRLYVAAVRPDWTGSEALFGYEDALKPAANGKAAWTVPDTLAFLLRATEDPKYPYVLILDEMNLAHVERYFADVLSGMESGHPVLPNLVRTADGYWRQRDSAPSKIAFPTNVFVIGTVNIDETTYMFSPKVLDRANTFEFRVRTSDIALTYRKPVV